MLDTPASNRSHVSAAGVVRLRRRWRALTALAVVGVFGWSTSACSSSATSSGGADRSSTSPWTIVEHVDVVNVVDPATAGVAATVLAGDGGAPRQGHPAGHHRLRRRQQRGGASRRRHGRTRWPAGSRAMKGLLSGADLTVANLETAITYPGPGRNEGVHVPVAAVDPAGPAGGRASTSCRWPTTTASTSARTAWRIRSRPSTRAPIPVVGIGANDDEAFAPAHFTVKGLRIAVIGATQVLDSSLITAWTATADHGGLASAKRVDRLVAEVKRARSDERHRHRVPALGHREERPARTPLRSNSPITLADGWTDADHRRPRPPGAERRVPRQVVRRLRPRQLRLPRVEPRRGAHRRPRLSRCKGAR